MTVIYLKDGTKVFLNTDGTIKATQDYKGIVKYNEE